MIREIKTDNREEWKNLRSQYIGGSDSAAVVGLNPFKSAYSLWAEKTGKLPPFEGNLTTEVGAYLEEFVAKLFERETGKKVRRNNRSMINDKYPWAIANIDREVVGEDAVLEIKTTSEMNLKKFKNGDYPPNYYAQLMHYLAVTERKKGYLAVLIGNRDFRWFEIERDEDEINALMHAEELLYKCIKEDSAPPTDGTESTSEAISTLYPESVGESVSLFGYDSKLEQYIAIGNQIKELKELQDEMANDVKAFMGESGKGESDSYTVSWISSNRTTFDSKKFAADHSDMDLSDYYKNTPVRTFRVTEKNGGKTK